MREKTISLDFILVFLCVLHIVPWNFYWEYSHGVAFAEAASLLTYSIDPKAHVK